ncbi:tail fiber [Limosilactobacillus fermentum]|nr:tail fiber [Limosilactobacillus fermentum]
MVNSGVQGVLIRLGHGIIRDPCASGHIAKAKQYGLYWHGYHTYEGVVNEPQFTIKNANELGLSTSQYYFVDLTNSSDPFNDYYALHATWLSQGYSTGLLISNEDYLSKFTDSEVTASGSLRWLISDTEPANYDIWQYSSEGTVGTSSVKVGFNFAKTDKLKYNLSTTLTGADINKDPYNPQAPVGGAYIGWGYDTTGLGGGKTFGYSTNGKNFYALVGPKGLVVRKSDGNRIYGTIADQIDSAISANVIPAKSAADSAVAYANDAIEKSKVNSQAIDDINSAVSDAKQGTNDALSRAMSAWDAARSNVNLIDSNYASASASISSARTEAIAAADEAKSSASVAQAGVVAVKSDVAAVKADVTATKSDVAVAKSDIADTKTTLAQTASDLNSKITGVETSLADTTSALSDAKTALASDVADAKKLANTAQTTADSAVKSVSSVADDLTAVASQAKANANGITKVTSDVGLLKTTVADNTGNISTIQETAKQIQQAVSDNAGNITVAKQTADSAVTVASDAKSNATVAVQTASQASITATNASGQAASAVITANGAMTTASDAKSNATVAVQTASGASLTAINAKSDATVAKQTASEAKIQASNAESDFAQLSIRAGQIEASVANNSGAIASVQQTANGLTTTVAKLNARDGINLLQGTSATDNEGPLDFSGIAVMAGDNYTFSGVMSSPSTSGVIAPYIQFFDSSGTKLREFAKNSNVPVASGTKFVITATAPANTVTARVLLVPSNSSIKINYRLLKFEHGSQATPWTPAPTDASVAYNSLKVTVDQTSDTINDPKTGLNATYQTAAGNATTISNVKGDISQLKVSASSASVALSDAAGNISSLQATAKSFSAALSDTNSNVASVTATASDLETKYADAAGDISQIKTDAKGMTQTISDAQGDIAKLKTRADGFDTQFSNINGSINKIQTDATGTTQTLTNAKSDIAVLQSRADGLDAKYADAAGDINTLKANASGFSQTLTDAKGDISTLKSTVSGVQNTLTDAQGNISTLQSDVSGLKQTTSDHTGSIATLQATANTLTSQMSSAQGDISTLKQTASGISSQVSGMETSLADANGKINDITSNGGGRNLLCNSIGKFQPNKSVIDNWMSYAASTVYMTQGQQYTVHANASSGLIWSGTHNPNVTNNNVVLWLTDNTKVSQIISDAHTDTGTTFTWNNPSGTYYLRVNTYKSDNSGYVEKVMLEKGTVAHDWSPAPEDTDAKITANTTAIDQNKKAIMLKADQTTVDKANGTVQQLQSQLKVQADQIKSKVSSSDLDAKGYATQEYTQTQIKQTSDSWNANLASVKDDLTQSYTNLSATVDGIQAEVYNKDGSSKITQLSSQIATKVSSGDFTSTTTQLKNLINQRVQVGDVISQINQEAGGDTLIQVSNGKKSLILDAGNTIFTGKAWIPDAAISSISADKIMLGSSALWNSDGTLNLVNQSNGLKALMQVKQGLVQNTTQSIISFASDYNTRAFSITPVGATVTPTLFFERYDQVPDHWLGFTRNEVEREGIEFNTWDNEGERFFVDCHARFHKNLSTEGIIYQGSWNNTTGKPLAGILSIESGNTIWSGSGYLAVGDHVSNSYTNVIAKSFSQQSTLSSKTNIEEVDPKDALDLVNQTDIRSYQYKSDVAQGKTKRYTSLIIDNVNDVSKYYAPDEFINDDRTGRDDGSAVGYLFLAVQELTRRIKTLEEKLNG